jgi:hypothetical protein
VPLATTEKEAVGEGLGVAVVVCSGGVALADAELTGAAEEEDTEGEAAAELAGATGDVDEGAALRAADADA